MEHGACSTEQCTEHKVDAVWAAGGLDEIMECTSDAAGSKENVEELEQNRKSASCILYEYQVQCFKGTQDTGVAGYYSRRLAEWSVGASLHLPVSTARSERTVRNTGGRGSITHAENVIPGSFTYTFLLALSTDGEPTHTHTHKKCTCTGINHRQKCVVMEVSSIVRWDLCT